MDIDGLEAGRELDALVAEKVFGLNVVWDRVEIRYSDGSAASSRIPLTPDSAGDSVKRFSTNIAAAWEVVERLKELGHPEVEVRLHPEGATCVIQTRYAPGWLTPLTSAAADTAPLAICRAALQAVR